MFDRCEVNNKPGRVPAFLLLEKTSFSSGDMMCSQLSFISLTKACQQKCVPHDYREAELNKGESVCLDRCAAKFFDVHLKVSELLQQESQRSGGGGGFGFGA